MIGKKYKIKAGMVFLCFFGALFFMAYRLIDIQVIDYSKYAYKAKNMHHIKIPLLAKRGQIYDHNGNVLAMSVPMPSVYANPQEIKGQASVVAGRRLAEILGMEYDVLYQRMTRDKGFVWLKRKITLEQKERIEKLSMPGIHFLEESTRFYPKNKLAGHVLGFVNIDNEGMEGIELMFNEHLAGRPGQRLSEKDAAGREVIAWRSLETPAVNGNNIVVTLDEVIQYFVEEELNEAMEKYHPQSAIAVVMDPGTGEVLAMANRPNYDPNTFNTAKKDNMKNRAVTDCFEPGSVFKMFIAAAALEENLYNLHDTIFCENGAYRVPGGTLHDHRPHGMLTFQQVVEKSSNIGMAKVGQKMGKEVVYQYIKDFGFGSRTGILLPGEIAGITHSPIGWSRMSVTRIPMGHEVAVTAIQLAAAVSVIANGGKLMQPLIVKKITDSQGRTVKTFHPRVIRDVINQDIAGELTIALEGVVGPQGTAGMAALSEFRVAGKTGTAQKINPDGTYSHKDFIGSFIGFVPAQNPRLVIAVILDSPKPYYYGGVTAAPVFKNIARKTLAYLDVEPGKRDTDNMMAKK